MRSILLYFYVIGWIDKAFSEDLAGFRNHDKCVRIGLMCGAANLVRFGLGAGTEQYLALGRGLRTFCADQRRSPCADLVDMRCHGMPLRRDDDVELSGARAVHNFIDDGRGYKRRNKSI